MDSSSQKPATMNDTTEAALSALLSKGSQSQNSFIVFGNVYVTNQGLDQVKNSSDREATADAKSEIRKDLKPKIPKERKLEAKKDSTLEDELSKRIGNILVSSQEVQKLLQPMLKEILSNLCMLKATEEPAKSANDREISFNFGESNEDCGINIKYDSEADSDVVVLEDVPY
jgi:hypothetical protein